MGQAASLQVAQRCLERDFSSRLLLSHGLYRSPYPRGTYVLCEVDLTGEVLPKPGNEVRTELVVQVILLDEEATDGSSGSSDSRSYGKLSESGIAQERNGAPKGRVSLLDTTSENREVDHKDEAACVRARGDSWVASSKTQVVQELLDKLAPGVSIEPVSFEAILRNFQKYNSQNKGASAASGRVENDGDRGSSIKSTGPQGAELEIPETLKSTNFRHPNFIHLLGAYEGERALYLLFPPTPFSLETVLHFSPSALGSEDHIRLLVFQMLSGLAHCHAHGVIHGNLRPWNVLLTDTLWCWFSGFQRDLSQRQEEEKLQRLPSLSSAGDVLKTSEDVLSTKGGGFGLTGAGSNTRVEVESSCLKSLDDVSDFKGSSLLAEARTLNMSDWRGVFKRWWAGELSNYDYLLLLNKLAGRRWGDRCFHTVMPWVIDFSGKPDIGLSAGWRDLTKSKWRLAKGDEQLDFTYLSAEMPHHVSDECLSELAVCIYKARRLPLLVLRRIVRSVYEPNEYPSSMQRLYQWTPDECIPEFYSDPDVFRSIHQGMSNLAVPLWSHSAEEFISLHRAALESDRVSQQLHHWIDLTFGYKLSGQAAIDAKNVTLISSDPTVPRCSGRRQLFSLPHPRRRDQYLLSSSLSRQGQDVLLKLQTSGKEPVSTWRVRNKSSRPRLGTVKANGKLVSTVAEGKEAGSLKRASDHFRRIAPLEGLEEATFFCESARHLSPCYRPSSIHSTISQSDLSESMPVQVPEEKVRNTISPVPSLGIPNKTNSQFSSWEMSPLDQAHDLASTCSGNPQQLANTLKTCKTEDDRNLENLVWWEAIRQRGRQGSSGEGADMFAAACIIAELYLRKPIFDPVSMAAFRESGALPETLDQLPPAVLSLIKPPLDPDFSQRPSAETLLKSPFFSTRVRAVYKFLAPLHSLGFGHHQLQYATTMAELEAFQYLGPVATEMVAPFCLSLIVPPSSGHDPTAVVSLLRELLRALKPHVSRRLLVPVIQQLLQSQDSSMSVTLLQPLFLREVLKNLGTATHLEHFHSLVLANLRRSPDGRQEEAAAAVLISMCHDLGLPITLHQTLTPLMQSFGRDISVSGIDALVGIGERLGERVVVKHIVPAVRSIVLSGLELSYQGKVGPAQSWRLLAMVDALAVLDRLILFLPPSTILSELLQEPHNIYIRILSQPKLSSSLLQCAAKALLLVCQCVGSEVTAALVLPQLKPLFDAVAFKHEDSLGTLIEKGSSSVSSRESQDSFQSLVEPEKTQMPTDPSMEKTPHSVSPDQIELVHTLYPGLAVLLGIQRLRQCLATWLLLEQALMKHFNWKWEGIGGVQVKSSERITLDLDTSSDFASDRNPANLLVDGVGWSIPQSQSQKWNKSSKSGRLSLDSIPERTRISNAEASVSDNEEAWYWVPGKGENMGASEAFARSGGGLGLAKDEQPWELNSVILHSWQVHSGVVRATAVAEDENTVLTAGGGPKGGSVVRQWKLATSECSMEYGGHQEAVIDICLLPGRERVASCDGTLHIWSAQTGEQLACFDEASNSTSSTVITSLMSSPIEGGRSPNHVGGSLSGTSPSGSFNANFSRDHLYTCLHSMEAEERLVTGTVNGSLRFFDIVEGRRLHMWRCEPVESFMSSYVSAIASSGQRKSQDLSTNNTLPSAWVAVGLSSGQCQLLDYRSGRVVVRWQAHDGSITKLDVLDELYLVSSSVDKSLSLWDLRRGVPKQLQTFRGHSDGVTSFTLRGTDMLSAAGNKIGLSSLCKSQQFGQERQVIQPQKLYTRRGGVAEEETTTCLAWKTTTMAGHPAAAPSRAWAHAAGRRSNFCRAYTSSPFSTSIQRALE